MQFYARCQSQPGHFPAIPSRVLRVRDVQLVPRMAILVSRSHADDHPVRTTARSGTVRTEPLADAYRGIPKIVESGPSRARTDDIHGVNAGDSARDDLDPWISAVSRVAGMAEIA